MVAALGIVGLSLLSLAVVGFVAYFMYLSSGYPQSEDRR